jgi:TRAP-type mannitol/chloroaromatic compound transport system permease large subunit
MGTAGRLEIGTAGRLLFIAAVTCYLLGRIFAGVATPLETVIYGATAALGVEFLVACWQDLWQHG